MLRRWLVALAALTLGAATSGGILVLANPDAGAIDAYVAARDVPPGSPIQPDMVQLQRVKLGATAVFAFSTARAGELFRSRAAHELLSGQLIQNSDLAPAKGPADLRLVYVPVHGVPPLAPGDRVDLLTVTGSADRLTVAPFLLGVEVRLQTPDGLVAAVTSEQAVALLYASTAVRLAAVVAAPGTAPGAETSVSDLTTALQAAQVGQR